jgi:hypothetical protein
VVDVGHGKYVVTQPKQNLVIPGWAGNLQQDTSTRVMYLDSEVIKGAFYVECVWFWPTEKEDKASPAPHTHDYDEVIGFFGTDPNDLSDLGAEIEFYIDGERNVMTETFLAFVPKGVVHCPLNILKITRPVFHFAAGQGKDYVGESNPV